MTALMRKFNYRNITLEEGGPRETVGVLLRDGEARYVPWLGFLELDQAKQTPGARPVKLIIKAVSMGEGLYSWDFLKPGQYVQGAYTGRGVYAVTVGREPRIIESPR